MIGLRGRSFADLKRIFFHFSVAGSLPLCFHLARSVRDVLVLRRAEGMDRAARFPKWLRVPMARCASVNFEAYDQRPTELPKQCTTASAF